MESARVIIEVVAGLIPGTPMPEYTKRWGITSAEFYGPENDPAWKPSEDEVEAEALRRTALIHERYDKAVDYMGEIMDPSRVNWIRVDWIWL